MSTLNQHEKILLNSIENGELQTIDNVDGEIKRYQSYANYHIMQKQIKVDLAAEKIYRKSYGGPKFSLMVMKFENFHEKSRFC